MAETAAGTTPSGMYEGSSPLSDNIVPLTSPAANRASGCSSPPKRHHIDAFMVEYTAHLPYPVFEEAETPAAASSKPPQMATPSARLMAPYLYTGADYALALAACFPTRCVDLSLLNWSATPLASQRLGNLRVFCEAARALALPDAPLSALQPERLQSSPACVVAHLKVQHWLYSLSKRFKPHDDHDAAALRAMHRHRQLGEPHLKRQRPTESGQRQDVCPSVHECGPISAQDLQRCCKAALDPVPPFTEVPPDASGRPGVASSNATGRGDKENDASTSSSGGAEGSVKTDEETSRTEKQKPWLSYSKPWLLPSLRAAEAKKAASEAAAAKRAQEERQRNPRYAAFVAQSRNVQQQYVVSRAAVVGKREQLRAVKSFVMEAVAEGRTLDYKEVADRLRGQC
jgi:hypothetical protein